MAKKRQNKQVIGTKTNHSEENVENLWPDFSEQMENKLKELFESSTTEYQEIYKCWTEFSDKMSKNMLDATFGDESICKNIYNSWKEYSEKLNLDLSNLLKTDDKSHTDLMDFWSEYSEKLNEQFSNLMREGFKEPFELYELWMDTYAKTLTEGSRSGDISSIISKYWLDVLNRFTDVYSTKGIGLTTSISPSGQKEGIEPGEQIYKQYEEIYNYWVDASQKMLDEIMRSPAYGNFLAQSINSSMDNRKMLENMMTENFKNLGITSRNELEEIRLELKNITSRLDNINQTIQNNSKKK